MVVTLPEELLQRLEAEAARRGGSVAELVSRVLMHSGIEREP